MTRHHFIAAAFLTACVWTVTPGAVGASDANPGVRQGLISVGGAMSASIAHNVDDPKKKTTFWSVFAPVSYFVTDPLSLDLVPEFSGNFDGDRIIRMHFAGSYHFMPRERFTPFLQGGLGFTDLDIPGIDDTHGSYLVAGGLKYFVVDNVTVDGTIRYTALFDDPGDGFISYTVGLSLYFQ